MAKWVGFSEALKGHGSELQGKSSKNPYAYRATVMDLGSTNMPVVLRDLIEAIVQ